MQTETVLSSLAQAAKNANILAHSLKLTQPSESAAAFRLKADLLGIVITAFEQFVRFDGVRPDGTVLGLEILTTPPVRLHCPLSALRRRPEAHAIARRRQSEGRVVSPLRDILKSRS